MDSSAHVGTSVVGFCLTEGLSLLPAPNYVKCFSMTEPPALLFFATRRGLGFWCAGLP